MNRQIEREELFTILFAALAILVIRKIPFFGDLLTLIPILGPSIPFFLLSIGVFIWLLKKGRTLSDFGLNKPDSFLKTFLLAVLIGAVKIVLVSLILNLFELPIDISRIDPLKGNLSLLLILLPMMWIVNGFGEELLHRAVIMKKLAIIFGNDKSAWIKAIIIHAVFFGLGHAYQGLTGIFLTILSAIIYGAAFYLTNKNLYIPVIAHSFANSIAFLESYFDTSFLL